MFQRCSAVVNSDMYVVNSDPTMFKFNGCEFEAVAGLPGPSFPDHGGWPLCGVYNDKGTEKLLICTGTSCRLWDPVSSNGTLWGNMEDFPSPGRGHNGGQLIIDGYGGKLTLIGGSGGRNYNYSTAPLYVEVFEPSLNRWVDESSLLKKSNFFS